LLRHVVGANGGRQGIGVLDLLVDVVLVVSGAQLGVAAESQGPVDHAHPVMRLRILRLQRDVLLVVGLGLFEFLWIERRARHLEENGAYAIMALRLFGSFSRISLNSATAWLPRRIFCSEGAPGMYWLA